MRKLEAEARLESVRDLKRVVDESTLNLIKKALIKQALLWIEQLLKKWLKAD